MSTSWTRLALAVYLGALTAFLSWVHWSVPHFSPSDYWQLWKAAQAYLAGDNPYHAPLFWPVAGHGNSGWSYPRLVGYPFTAVLATVPLAPLPLRVVDPLVAGLSGALLCLALTRQRLANPSLLVFVSVPYFYLAQATQWSAVLMAGALLPGAGWLLACKPSIGAALWLAYPRGRAAAWAAGFVVISIALWPGWVREWLDTLSILTHMAAPVTMPGGVLILLTVLRWRRPEARLLLALSLVPQTLAFYEAVPLFLVPQRWSEAWLLWAGTFVGYFLARDVGTYIAGAHWLVWLGYLPAVAMVLRRPNVWDDADLESWASLRAWWSSR
jgi:hypothetical protein